MKIGIVVTMYDEFDVVSKTINHLNNSEHEIKIIVIHSDNKINNEILEHIKKNSSYYELVSDLSTEYDKFELPSAVVCRNYSIGFTELYQIGQFDYVIGITADTLIYDINKLLSVIDNTKYGFVLQAIGQNFHSSTDDPKNGVGGNRYQHDKITDIMPQLFIFRGDIASEYKLFSDIKNSNKFTSEQNLGDSIINHVSHFHDNIKRLHNKPNVYDFNEGVILQIKGLGHTRISL